MCRYETASGFADDVRRYLDDQPILARSPSLAYRITKFNRRYRWAFAIATLFIGVLLAGIGTTTWMWQESRGQAQRAQRFADDYKSTAIRRLFRGRNESSNVSYATQDRRWRRSAYPG